MKRLLAGLFASLFTLVSFSCSADGQNPNPFEQTGIVSGGTYAGGGIDAVSMQSGGLSAKIPLFSIPQKGNLALSFSLVLNNPLWTYTSECFDTYCSLMADHSSSPIGPTLSLDQSNTVSRIGAQMGLVNYSQPVYNATDGSGNPTDCESNAGGDGCYHPPTWCTRVMCAEQTNITFAYMTLPAQFT